MTAKQLDCFVIQDISDRKLGIQLEYQITSYFVGYSNKRYLSIFPVTAIDNIGFVENTGPLAFVSHR